MAAFLTVAGLTGSLLAFGHEIDTWLNPRLFVTEARGKPLSFDAMVQRLEAYDPGLRVTYLSFDGEAGHTAFAYVGARPVQGSAVRELGYDQAFIDPVTGEILGVRLRGACCLEPENFVQFLLTLHYSLVLPGSWGWWLMGGVALIWLADCFIGLYLTLPRIRPFWRKWKPSWLIKCPAGSYRRYLDLHRAGGLWLWGVLLLMALSSVSLNLYEEVFSPVVSVFSPLTPFPVSPHRATMPLDAPRLSFEDMRTRGDAEVRRRGWEGRVSGVAVLQGRESYLVALWPSHFDRGPGLGAPAFYYDAFTGDLLGTTTAEDLTAGDVFAQLQFPLHSGQVAGLPGRILVSITGLVVALLSVTGVVLWWKKRSPRNLKRARRAS